MIEERVEVREGSILIIHTGYHHFGWDQPRTRPTRSATWSSTSARPRVRRVVQGQKDQVDRHRLRQRRPPHACTCAPAQVNTIIRNWMPRQTAEADKLFREMYGRTMEERPDRDRRQVPAHAHRDVPLSHHPRRVPGRRHRLAAKWRAVCGMQPAGYAATIGFSRSAWGFVDGESCISSVPSGLGAASLWSTTPSTRR
jgi:arylformamidase